LRERQTASEEIIGRTDTVAVHPLAFLEEADPNDIPDSPDASKEKTLNADDILQGFKENDRLKCDVKPWLRHLIPSVVKDTGHPDRSLFLEFRQQLIEVSKMGSPYMWRQWLVLKGLAR